MYNRGIGQKRAEVKIGSKGGEGAKRAGAAVGGEVATLMRA